MTSRSLSLPVKPIHAKNPALSYLDNLGSRGSATTMHNCLTHIAQILGRTDIFDADWGALRRHHILFVMQKLKDKNIAPATINLYFYSMKGVAKEAWSCDVMPQSAYLKISILKALNYVRLPVGRSLSKLQCRKLLEACNDETLRGARDKALLAIMIGCGLRRAEVVALKIENWNSQEKTLCFIGKGNKQRKVFIPVSLLDNLQQWFEVRGLGEGAMFPRITGHGKYESLKTQSHMLASSVYRIVRRRSRKANIPDITPHDLRRTFATIMLDAGVDLFVLQQAMGHANLAITARYDRRGEKAKAKAAKILKF